MIIKTRYRDIPFEEARSCILSPGSRHTKAVERLWNKRRGSTLLILTGVVVTLDGLCEGPRYAAVKDTDIYGGRIAVCPHIAEIGD